MKDSVLAFILSFIAILFPLSILEMSLCNGNACVKAGTFSCPECLRLQLDPKKAAFCSQDCFKSSWKQHKILHKASVSEQPNINSFEWNESMDDQEILHHANAVDELLEPFVVPRNDSQTASYQMISMKSSQLSINQRSAIFSLLKANMRSIYDSCSWGWNDKTKFAELTNMHSRFLLISPVESPDEVAAFAMFRFDWDDDDEPEYAVLYVYELQIGNDLRRKGVGRLLMSVLQRLQTVYHMRKTMLTCFKHNVPALLFYKSIGFGVDANSPSFHGNSMAEYEILSNQPRR